MRTGLFLLAAFLLLAGSAILGKLFSANYPTAMTGWLGCYIILWLVVAFWNMWTGVYKAGYSFGEELPVFALIALVPAVAAVLLKWKFFPVP